MKMYAIAIASLLLLAGTPSFAADGKDKAKQQSPQAACAAQAGKRTGAERQEFIDNCLKTYTPDYLAKPKATMQACTKSAIDKKLVGAQRSAYMGACLKAKGPSLMTD